MKKEIAVIIPLVIMILAIGGWLFFGKGNKKENNAIENIAATQNTSSNKVNNTVSSVPSDTATNNTASDSGSDSITLVDVAEHSQESDCWLVIDDNVYDVTEFIPEHPGGDRILQGCGKDATDLFTGESTLGRVHSAVARALLKKYIIGPLAN